MDNPSLGNHISQQFNEELEDVRNRVMMMGGLVEQQLEDAVKALVNRDADMGGMVSARDYQVNEMDVSIDEECTQIIAKRQPAATDLRLVMAVIKTTADLERIGDEAKRIGKMVERLVLEEGKKKHFSTMEVMAELVGKMLHDALDAFARMDADAALQVCIDDQKVDEHYESIMRQLVTYMMEDPRSIPWVMDVIWSARALERIGDRASNISEYVIYLVKGKDVRHTSLEKIEKEII